MKIFFLILASIGLFSCGRISNMKKNIPAASKVYQANSTDTSRVSAAIQLSFSLPEGFSLDSIKYYDKKHNAQIVIAIPVSGIIVLDREIRNGLVLGKDMFLQQVENMIKKGSVDPKLMSYYLVKPIIIYKNTRIISYSFIYTYYYSGAANQVDEFISYNFGLNEQKKIEFGDYFSIKTKSDTALFIDLINKAINPNGITILEIKEPDFNIEPDIISINYGDYMIAGYGKGLIQAKIPISKLRKNINTRYR